MGEQGIVLEDETHSPLVRLHKAIGACHFDPLDPDAPLRGTFDAGHETQKRGLAGP